MSDYYDFEENGESDREITDAAEVNAKETIRKFFEQNQESVFFSRQIEVLHEKQYFHWITNRAIRDLIAEGMVKEEVRKLNTKGTIKLLWHKNYRYYKRSANELVQLVEAYANPNITGALGLQGEVMILEAFARSEFVMKGRSTRCFQGKCWTKNDKDIDFIFEKDSIAYGIEVKNTLGYIDYEELQEKTELCHHIGVRPVFAVRMMPKSWAYELINNGGFALIFKYQLYPWSHSELAKQVSKKLKLPVDSPRVIQDGTMQRFIDWHTNVISKSNSHGTS